MSDAGLHADIDSADLASVSAQLGRSARGVRAVAHRCPCGAPDVIRTASRLPDGSPFPTLYYLTCPRAVSAVGRLEASGLMADMSARLRQDDALRAAYTAAHVDYLARRASDADVPEITGVSAGGMPDRVKCLHALAAHALAVGTGVNPLGDETLQQLGPWWAAGRCVAASAPATQ